MTAAAPRPNCGHHGIAMPTNPPITQASCRVVSPRAKALEWARAGTPVWIVESSETLARYWLRPAVSPSAISAIAL